MFLHERVFNNSLYFAFYFGPLMICIYISVLLSCWKWSPLKNSEHCRPTMAGLTSSGWLNATMPSITFLMVAVGFPRNNWHRAHPEEIARTTTNHSNRLSKEGITFASAKGAVFEKSRTPHDFLTSHIPPRPRKTCTLGRAYQAPGNLNSFSVICTRLVS